MDSFYASVEIRDNPALKGRPVGIGSPIHKRGVLCTANYEARKYGVKAALPTMYALKLCPDLILVKPNFEKYRKVSLQIREIFKEYTDLIEPLSLDEAFLDVSNCKQCDGSATLIAKEIRDKIFETTKLTASAGIAPNKFLAKIASDWKKPNGQFVITPEEVSSFIFDLPVKKIFGVGKVTAEKLHGLGFETCGDIQKASLLELRSSLGSTGESLYKYSRGIDNREVRSSRERKSLSVEHTFSKDIKKIEEMVKKATLVFEELKSRLDKKDIQESKIKSVFVKIKFKDFKQTTVSDLNSNVNLNDYLVLMKKGLQRKDEPIRLLGLGVQLKTRKKESEFQTSFLKEGID